MFYYKLNFPTADTSTADAISQLTENELGINVKIVQNIWMVPVSDVFLLFGILWFGEIISRRIQNENNH